MHTFMAKQLTFIWELVEKEMYVFIYKDGQENGNVYEQKNKCGKVILLVVALLTQDCCPRCMKVSLLLTFLSKYGLTSFMA